MAVVKVDIELAMNLPSIMDIMKLLIEMTLLFYIHKQHLHLQV